jgi:hypothetical protein
VRFGQRNENAKNDQGSEQILQLRALPRSRIRLALLVDVAVDRLSVRLLVVFVLVARDELGLTVEVPSAIAEGPTPSTGGLP